MNKRTPFFLVAVTCAVSTVFQSLRADDWSGWLGPQRDGSWHESGIVKEFPTEGPSLKWRCDIAGGYSGPAVAAGQVFVMDWRPSAVKGQPKLLHDGDVPTNQNFVRQLRPGTERLLCIHERTGDVNWVFEYDCPYTSVATYAIGPRATPTVDGSRVYTLGSEGDLHCLDVMSGKLLWSKNYQKDYGVPVPNWGFACPPLIEDDKLICIVGGEKTTCVAFDKTTGKELWRALTAKEPGYSAPVIRVINDERQLLVWDSDNVSGLNPQTGEVYWSVRFPSTFAMSVATPQVHGNSVFVMCFNGKCALITVAEDGRSAEVSWQGGRRKGIDGVHNTSQLVAGHIYGCGNGGRYTCARLADGEQLWSTFAPASAKRPLQWGNVFTVRNGDLFYLANDRGELIIANLTPAGYRELDRAALIEPTHDIGSRKLVWSHPAFANRCVYLRNDREIRAYSLADETLKP